MLEIIQAQTNQDIELIRNLLEEYGKWGVNVGLAYPEEYQAFLEQLANLPGVFAPPDGCLLLAKYKSHPAGCVALRKLSDDTCEMKRLYVAQEFRGLGIGRFLAIDVIERARKIGYTRMRLDTVASMKAARELYKSLGFKEIESYRYNPLEGATFMELELT